MDWKYNNIRIFVQEEKEDTSQIIPRLQPLNGGTVLQFFGYNSPILSLSALIVGSGDYEGLKGLTQSGVAYELDSPEGVMGNYYLHSLSFKREKTMIQTIRPDLDCYAPIWTVDLDLYPVE